MERHECTRPAQARSNAVWGSGKIAGAVAVIATVVALVAPGTASAYYSSRSYLPPPIAPTIVVAPTVSATADATVSWGDVSWGDVV